MNKLNKSGFEMDIINSRFLKQKSGFEMAISMIVIIVLAIFVLIGLLVFWNNETGIFSDILKNVIGTSNVDSIVVACNSFIIQEAGNEYCCVKRDIKINEKMTLNLTCDEFRSNNISNGRVNFMECGQC